MDLLSLRQATRKELLSVEQFWLNSPLGHQIYVHTRRYSLLCGVGLTTIGAGLLCTNFGLVLAALTLSIGMLVLASVMLWIMLVRCPCREEPLLTPEGRRQLRTSPPTRTIGIAALSVVALLTALCTAHCFISGYLCGIVSGSILVVLGMCTTVASLTRYVDRSLGLRLVDHHEHARAQQLNEDNLDELDELIAYHLRIGNFEQADHLSRRMLLIAEKQMH